MKRPKPLIQKLDPIEKREGLAAFLKCPASQIPSDLVFPLLEDPDPSVWLMAARVLVRTQHPAVFSFLVGQLAKTEDDSRAQIVDLLRQLKIEAAVLPLLDLLTDRSAKVRSAAALTFLAVGDKAFHLLLKKFPSLGREDRVKILKTFGESPVGGEPLFQKGLQDEDWWVRSHAVQALSNHSSQAATELLISVLDDPIPMVRLSVLRALKTRKSPSLKKAVAGLVNDPNSDISAAATAIIKSR